MKRLADARRRRRARAVERRAWVHAAGCVVCESAVCAEILRDSSRGRGERARVVRERRAAVPPLVVDVQIALTTPIRPARLMVSRRALVTLQPDFHRGGLEARRGERPELEPYPAEEPSMEDWVPTWPDA